MYIMYTVHCTHTYKNNYTLPHFQPVCWCMLCMYEYVCTYSNDANEYNYSRCNKWVILHLFPSDSNLNTEIETYERCTMLIRHIHFKNSKNSMYMYLCIGIGSILTVVLCTYVCVYCSHVESTNKLTPSFILNINMNICMLYYVCTYVCIA
jgi:hypothetical protein